MTDKKPLNLDQQRLCGLTQDHLIEVPALDCQLHVAVVEPLLKLAERAGEAGFCLRVASSYRSFERQLLIWNAKASGLRPVLDDAGQAIDIDSLSERDLVFAILRWSALPGASRHHWGTDLDVYDSVPLTPAYTLQLTLEETQGAGPFAPFHQWLSEILARDEAFGFYRPYALDWGGVAPEPWHLSYAPLAKNFSLGLTEALLRDQINASDIRLKQTILEHLSEIYQRFVRAVG